MSTVDEYWALLLRQWLGSVVIATLAKVLAPATGKPSSGFGSVNTVKSIKVLSCSLCFIGVQWTDEMPLRVSSSAMRIALDARFLEGALVEALCLLSRRPRSPPEIEPCSLLPAIRGWCLAVRRSIKSMLVELF